MARFNTVIALGALAALALPATAQDYPMAKTYSTVEEALASSKAPATTSTYQGTTYVNNVQDHGTPIASIEIFDTPVEAMDSSVVSATNRVTYESPTATYTSAYGAPATSYTAPIASQSTGAYTYSVQLGDTLYSIAKRNGLKVSDLMNANGLTSSALAAGQALSIPGSSAAATTTYVQAVPQYDSQVITASQPATVIRSVQPIPSTGGNVYRVLPGDTLYSIAKNNCASVSGIANATGITRDSILSPGQALTLPAGHCAQ